MDRQQQHLLEDRCRQYGCRHPLLQGQSAKTCERKAKRVASPCLLALGAISFEQPARPLTACDPPDYAAGASNSAQDLAMADT